MTPSIVHRTPNSYSIYSPEVQNTYAPWLRNYGRNVPTTVEPPEVPLYYWLDRAADLYPDNDALVFKNFKLTYRQLQQQAEIIAANLRAYGIQKGDMVSLMLPNLPQTIVAFWGVAKAGGIIVMTNPLYVDQELQHQLNDANVKCLITIESSWPKLEKLRLRLGVQKYFITSLADSLNFPLNLVQKFKDKAENNQPVIPYDGHTVLPYKNLLRNTVRLSTPIDDPKNEVALLQYSGGTTGVPKGAMLTHYNFSANIVQTRAVIFPDEQSELNQRFLSVLPLFHVYGLTTCLLLPASIGATVYPSPMFVPAEALSMLHKYRITTFPGAPSIYIAILSQKNIANYDLSRVLCISGSAPMPVEYIKVFANKTGRNICEGYGLTEASPITHLNPTNAETKPGSIGMPLPSTEARIVDMELGNVEVPPGRAGELIIKGPQVMKGYWNRPDETANILRNGWLYTGDIAIMDEEGFFNIIDRKKDMVIVGGYNVYPREIDEVLHSHPAVKEAVAVGIAHPTRGEIIKAYIVPRPGHSLSKNEIITYCRGKLANYKVPKQVEFREELPKSLVGKILRRALRMEELEKRERQLTSPEDDCIIE